MPRNLVNISGDILGIYWGDILEFVLVTFDHQLIVVNQKCLINATRQNLHLIIVHLTIQKY